MRQVLYAGRSLRRSPSFTLTAVATLAIGIGVNTAVFTVVNGALFKGFPLVQRNDRLVYITTTKGGVYYPDFENWQASARSFKGMALVRGVFETLGDSSGTSRTYFATQITSDAFRMLGVEPILGRNFVSSDALPGAAPVMLLRYELWDHQFGRDPRIVGRTVRLSGVPATVIGVMPRGFSFPENQDLWTPLIPTPGALTRQGFYARYAVGRLADGITMQDARAEMDSIGLRLGSAFPRSNRGVTPVMSDFGQFFIGPAATTLYKTAWAAVGFVLLIACANLANLSVARALHRSREIAIRSALGAGRWRLVRQFLVESVLLSALGGMIGWWIAQAGVRAYTLVQGRFDITHALSFETDQLVLSYVTAISIGTGVLFGVVPAVQLSRLDITAILHAGGHRALGVRSGARMPLLIAGQMALALVLLAGAGVMLRTFLHVADANIGVDTTNILTASLYLPANRYPSADEQISFYEQLSARLQALPGVELAAFGSVAPTEPVGRLRYELVGDRRVDESGSDRIVSMLVVSPDYFRSLGATVLSGRVFDEFDRTSSPPVALVNERFAKRNWPEESPLGKRFRVFEAGSPQAWLTVVGVVSDIVQNDPTRQQLDSLVYVPYRQHTQPNMFVFARARVAPATVAPAVEREVHALDATLPVPVLMPLAERLRQFTVLTRNITSLLWMFAAIGLLLATVGLHATVAQSVSWRTQEIGVRMALGATAADVRGLVIRQGLRPAVVGLLLGLPASIAVNRLLRSQLVAVSPNDSTTLAVSSFALIVVAFLGCHIPARRAMRVAPLVALKND